MDAVMFLKEKERMCASYMDCDDCPLGPMIAKTELTCPMFVSEFPEKVVAAIEQWSKEHPCKTRLADLLEKLPKTMRDDNGAPFACCKCLGYCEECGLGMDTRDCRDCWNEPLEEEEE